MRSRIPLLLRLAAVLILCVLILYGLLHRYSQIISNLPTITANELSTRLNRSVSIGSVKVLSTTEAVIYNIRVANGKSFAEGTLLYAPRTVVRFNTVDLLLGRVSIAQIIRSADVYNPSVLLIRQADGRWNVADLVKKPVPTAARFRGYAFIHSAKLTIRDYSSKILKVPETNTLEEISGHVDFRPTQYFYLDFSGQGAKDRFNGVHVSGRWGNTPRYTNIDLAISRANPEYWMGYFTQIKAWGLANGNLDANANLTQSDSGNIKVRGSGALRNAAFVSRHLRIPVRPFAANIRFIDTNLSVAGRGYIGKSPIVITGHILDIQHARLNLQLRSDNLNLNTVQSAIRALPKTPQIRWTVPASAIGSITGLGRSPIVTVSARVQHAEIYNTPISDVNVQGYYQTRTIHITHLVGQTARGNIDMNATINLYPLHLTSSGTFNGVDLAELPPINSARPRGTANGRLRLQYSRYQKTAQLDAMVSNGTISSLAFQRGHVQASLSSPNSGVFTIDVMNGNAGGIAYRSGSANLELRNGSQLFVRQTSIRLPNGGTLNASGTALLGGALNLKVAGNQLDAQRLLAPLGYGQFTGIVDVNGSVTGTLTTPRLTTAITSRRGQIRQVAYDFLSGSIIADKNTIVIRDAVLRSADSRVDTVGSITMTKNQSPYLDIRLIARRVSLNQLLSILNIQQRGSGSVNANITVRGRLSRLAASGRIDLTNAVIVGERIDSGHLDLQYMGGRTVITQLVANRDDMQVVGSGFVDNANNIHIGLRGQNLNLSLINNVTRPYVRAEGPFTFVGQISGVIQQPTISGSISAKSMLINDQPFQSLDAAVIWQHSRLLLTGLSLVEQGSTYRIPSIAYTPRTREVSLRAEVIGERVERIVALFQHSQVFTQPEGVNLRDLINTIPTPFTGAVSANIDLSGVMGNLSGGAGLNVADLKMGAQSVDSVNMQFVVQRSLFLLNHLGIRSPGIDIASTAQFVNAQPTRFAAEIRNTNASSLSALIQTLPFITAYGFGQRLVSAFASIPRPLSGTINADMAIANPTSGATGTFTASINNLSVQSTSIGTISSNGRFYNGSIIIDKLILIQPSAEAAVQGTINSNGIISMQGSGSNFDLGIFKPWLHVTTLSGSLDFKFDAEGSFANPFVTASFNAQNIVADSFSVDSISTNNLTIGANRISSNSLVIANKGAEINAFGSLPFVFRRPFIPTDQPIQFSITLSDPTLSLAKSFSPYVTRAEGTFSANIVATGTLDAPNLDGSIELSNGVFDIRGFKNSFTGVNLAAKFDGNTVRIEDFSGASSLGGRFSANGNIQINDLRSLAQSPITTFASADSLRLDVDNLSGTFNEKATFTTTGQITTTQTLGSPLVQGQLVVTDALIQLPSNLVATTVRLPIIPINPRFAVTVNLTRNVVIQRGTLRAEVQGPVTFTGVFPRPIISGTVQILNGRISYVGRTLELLEGGTASFYLQPPLPAVISVNVTARTRFSALSPVSNRITRYTLTMDISGPIGNLDIDVRTSPPGLTNVQALGNVFGGTAFQALAQGVPFPQLFEQQLGQILVGVALPSLLQPLSLGPVTLSLEPGYNIPLQVTASTVLTDKISLSYSRSVTGNLPIDTISLDYTLSSNFGLSIEFEGQNNAPRQTYFFIEYFTPF